MARVAKFPLRHQKKNSSSCTRTPGHARAYTRAKIICSHLNVDLAGLALFQLIFSDTYTQAEERNWHQRHFCCLECDKDLGGMLYVAKNGQPHCLECYDKFYAKVCNTCKNRIAADAQRIEHEGMFWHATDDCFNCAKCRRNLLGKQFLKAKNTVFCSVDCAKSY